MSLLNFPIRFNSSEVRQHNRLIEAKFTSHMTEREQKIILYIISEIKKSDRKLFEENRNKDINLSVQEFSSLLNVHSNSIYRDATLIASSITKKSIIVKYIGGDDKEAFEEIIIIPYMRYDAGVLTISVNSKVLQYLIDVKEDFTKFKLENILRLGSGYAIKIYQLLKQFERLRKRTFLISELKEILGVQNENCYKYYSQFKRDVLEISKKHINEKTDILIEYEETKIGRSVGKVTFYIKSKMTQYEQALIAFENFIFDLADNCVMKLIWKSGLTDKEELINRPIFNKAFKQWIQVNCKSYHPDEIQPLDYESKDTLLYDIEGNNQIVLEFQGEYLKSKK